MHIQHYEKDYRYTDREFLSVARKLGKLATYCKRIKDTGSSIRIDVENRATQKGRDKLKVGVTIDLPKKTLHAESRKETIVEAVDRCVEKLEPQLARYKQCHMEKGKSSRTRCA